MCCAYPVTCELARQQSRRAMELALAGRTSVERRRPTEAGSRRMGSLFRECSRSEAKQRAMPLAFPTAGTSNMPRLSRWPCRANPPGLKPSRMICEKRFPEDTFVRVQLSAGSSRSSCVESSASRPKRIELLQIAAPYELAVTLGDFSLGSLGGLYPVYVRGEAYLAAHQRRKRPPRIPEDSRSPRRSSCSDPIGALAHLQLGRAFALSGDQHKAKAAYQDFLTLWKDADPDIPILRQAKAEYAKLQ